MKTVVFLVLVLSLTIASASPSIAKDETVSKEGSSTTVIEGPDGSSIVSQVKPGFITNNVIKGPSAVATVIGPDAPKETEQNQPEDSPKRLESFQEKRLKPNRHILRPKPINLVERVPEIVPSVVPEILPEKPLSLNGLLALLHEKNKPSHKPSLPPCKLPPVQKPPSNCHPLVRPPVIQPQLPILFPPQHASCPHHVPGQYPPNNQLLYPQTAQSSQLLNGLVGSILQLLLLSSLQPNLHQHPHAMYMPPSYVPLQWLRPTPHDEYIDKSEEKFKGTMGNENKFAVAENQIILQDSQPVSAVYTPHNLLIPSNAVSYYNYPWTRSEQRTEESAATAANPRAE
ncbi:uncharacterized protein LOC108733247 [Agrilus planipennis]|uniref:Uncharacterized protein LOC108733247 n=1 Tax=Agrilus planipennis TaxID=224129 RepID=A0A1W4WIB2_AGRPL|nr:uncharacterized protein LOC108733247 [Agrilus planipennis]